MELSETQKEFIQTVNAVIKRNLDKLSEVNKGLMRNKVKETFTAQREAGNSVCKLSIQPEKSVWVMLNYSLENSGRYSGQLEAVLDNDIDKARTLAEIMPLIEDMIDEVLGKMQAKINSLNQFYQEFIKKHRTERIVEEL